MRVSVLREVNANANVWRMLANWTGANLSEKYAFVSEQRLPFWANCYRELQGRIATGSYRDSQITSRMKYLKEILSSAAVPSDTHIIWPILKIINT